jgi:LAO/AO transport system kinase
VSKLAELIVAGDRRALARAITTVESTRPDHREEAAALLTEVLPHTGDAIRIGISGAPGSGKSTFIEAFGLHLVEHGHRVAVLAVDPSSTRTGGSILGDKTRMGELTRSDSAFVRPSPTAGTLGGVARRTREAMLLCEAAGFDVVMVETVGVGQSEVAVAGMVDLFTVLVAPGAGDELQGIKRGIIELADVVVVNKNDGDLAPAAKTTATDYSSALRLVRSKTQAWTPRVVLVSALEGTGIDELWSTVEEFRSTLDAAGELGRRRAEQAREWMWSEVTESLIDALRSDERVADLADRRARSCGDRSPDPRRVPGTLIDEPAITASTVRTRRTTRKAGGSGRCQASRLPVFPSPRSGLATSPAGGGKRSVCKWAEPPDRLPTPWPKSDTG